MEDIGLVGPISDHGINSCSAGYVYMQLTLTY